MLGLCGRAVLCCRAAPYSANCAGFAFNVSFQHCTDCCCLHTAVLTRKEFAVTTQDGAAGAQVRANGLIIFVPKYGIEGPVYLTKKDSTKSQDRSGSHMQASTTASNSTTADSQLAGSSQDDFVLDEDKQMVVSKDGQRSYTVFDKAAVKISVEETFGHRRHLQLKLVDRSELPPSEQMS